MNNQNIIPPNPQIPTQNLSPITRFCCTIGNIPTSYMVSLSYEEQIMWLCDYLKNTVIPTLNNNSEAVTELQNLYVELKNYVDNYFGNLDVQEEINNKLDELVEDGTLASLINENLKTEIDNIENNNIAFTERVILKEVNDTEINLSGLTGSIQGLCIDEENNYIYRAFISSGQNGGINKYNISTGELVATTGVVENMGHSNCLCYFDGKIYATNGRTGYSGIGGLAIRVFDASTLQYLGYFNTASAGSLASFNIQEVNRENPGSSPTLRGKYSYIMAMFTDAAYRPRVSLLKSCNKSTGSANLSTKYMAPYRSFNYDHNYHTTQGACLKYPYIFIPLSALDGQPTNKILVHSIFGQKICELIFENQNLNLLEIEDVDVTNDLQYIYVGFNSGVVHKFNIGSGLNTMSQFINYSCGSTAGKYPLTCLASFNPNNENNVFLTNNTEANINLLQDLYFTPFNYNSTSFQGNKLMIECGLYGRIVPTRLMLSETKFSYESEGRNSFRFVFKNSDNTLHYLDVLMTYNLANGHAVLEYWLDEEKITEITNEVASILTPNAPKNLTSFLQIYAVSTGYSNNNTIYNGSYDYDTLS